MLNQARFLSGWMLVGLLWNGTAAVAAPELSLSSVTGAPGSVVNVDVGYVSDGNVVRGDFDVMYDATKVTPGTIVSKLTAPLEAQGNIKAQGQYHVLIDQGTKLNVIPTMVIATIPFTINANAPAGATNLAIPMQNTAFSGAAAVDVPLTKITPGVITVKIPAPIATVTPTTLDFGAQLLNVESAAKDINLANTGDASLAITSIVPSTGYTLTHNCGAAVAAGASCKISVKFKPTAAGAGNGTVTITSSNDAGSPHLVQLTGSGENTALTVNPNTGIDFTPGSATVVVGNSQTQEITLTNNDASAKALHITTTVEGSNRSDFIILTNTCNVPLVAGGSCKITIKFMPTAAGERSATLHIVTELKADINLPLIGSAIAPEVTNVPTLSDMAMVLMTLSLLAMGMMSFASKRQS